jgi:hypothetical protein
VLESAAPQVRLELVLDVTRQRPLLGRPPIPEGRIVLGHEQNSGKTCGAKRQEPGETTLTR